MMVKEGEEQKRGIVVGGERTKGRRARSVVIANRGVEWYHKNTVVKPSKK